MARDHVKDGWKKIANFASRPLLFPHRRHRVHTNQNITFTSDRIRILTLSYLESHRCRRPPW